MYAVFRHLLFLLLAPVLAVAALPPVPAVALPEGTGFIVGVRAGKLQQALTRAGLEAADYANMIPAGIMGTKQSDLLITSLVYAYGLPSGHQYMLVSLSRDLRMDEFLTAFEVEGAAGDEQLRATKQDGPYGRQVTVRKFSAREYLMTRGTGPATLAQPAKVLSTFRSQVAQSDCLVLGVGSGKELAKGFSEMAGVKDARIDDVVFGLQMPGALRAFARTTCHPESLAANLCDLMTAKMMIPKVPESVPAKLRPEIVVRAEGPVAAAELTVPGLTLPLFLTAAVSGMNDVRTASNTARAARYAQNIASVFTAACAAGSEKLPKAKGLDAIIALLEEGVVIEGGTFKGSRFSVPELDDESLKKEVRSLLKLKDGQLSYLPPAGEASEQQLLEPMPGAEKNPFGAKMNERKVQRNAQNAVSTFNAAKAAGSAALDKVKTVEAALEAINNGVNGGGPFSSSVFRVELTKAERREVAAYVEWDAEYDTLNYLKEKKSK